MQAYGREFAEVYNKVWKGFSTTFAPLVHAYFDEPVDKSLLDLFCGTGQFCTWFLARGWKVLGLDASAGMLRWAAENNSRWLAEGSFTTLQADASAFQAPGRFGLVSALFDAVNHLEDEAELAGCFRCAHAALLPGGSFIFDINTKKGLRNWTTLDVQDDEGLFLLKRGFFVEDLGRAWLEVIGFSDKGGGNYERFRELVYNRAWPVSRIIELLRQAGFEGVETLRAKQGLPQVAEPELEDRVFIVAKRPE